MAEADQIRLRPPTPQKNFLVGTRLSLGGSTAMLLQVWGEAIVNPELKALVEEMTDGLAELFAGYLTAWHKAQGMPKRRAEVQSALELPTYVALAQGFIVQCALNPQFEEELFFASFQHFLGVR